MQSSNLDLVRGTLDVLVLKALTWGPLHGYAVAGWIDRTTGGALLVEEGALYPALHRLERRGSVEAEWGLSENNRKAKYYRLTPRGRERLGVETRTWQRYVEAVSAVLAAESPEAAR
jgi:transcriptional regulator